MLMPEDADQQKQWDRTYSNAQDYFGKEPSVLAARVLPVLRENGVRTVLELGCGQGRDTSFFAGNRFEVTALDYSESGICQLRKCAKDAGFRATLKVHDAREPLPFPDASFDAVYSHMFFTMEFTEEEVTRMLAECRRVLRPGGINIFSVRNDHDPHYGKFEPRGKGTWRNPLGFVVHFFDEPTLTRMAAGYDLLWIKEFDEPSPSCVKKLYEVALRKPL